jgi:hypothetical protein
MAQAAMSMREERCSDGDRVRVLILDWKLVVVTD